MHGEQSALETAQRSREEERCQGDWAARVLNNGKVTVLFADYHGAGANSEHIGIGS
jgi:hypothetical protein